MTTEESRSEELLAARKEAEKVVRGMAEGPLKEKAFELAFLDLAGTGSAASSKSPRKSNRQRGQKRATSPKSPAAKKKGGLAENVKALKTKGFFKKHRDASAVQDKLLIGGHKYRTTVIGTALIRLTQAGSLQRVKEKAGGRIQWVYYE